MSTRKTSKPAHPAKPSAAHQTESPAEQQNIPPASGATTTWPDLLTRVGPPTADDTQTYGLDSAPLPELIKRGRNIASSKILTDLLRWSGQIADGAGPDGATHTVKGFDLGLLRVTVADGVKLRDLVSAHDTSHTSQTADKASDGAGAVSALDQGVAERDVLAAALRAAHVGDNAEKARIAKAAGASTKDGAAVASDLTALIKLARASVKAGGAPANRLARGKIDAAYLDTLAALATDVQAANERAKGARAGQTVTQSDLDAQDGRCLLHMEVLLDVFEAARATNPTVAHLVPNATRSYFGHRTTHNDRPGAPLGTPPGGSGPSGGGAGTPPAASGSTPA